MYGVVCMEYTVRYTNLLTMVLLRSPALAPHTTHEDIMSIARITTRKNKGPSLGQSPPHYAEGPEEGSEEGGTGKRKRKRKRKRKLPRGGWYPPFGLHHETDTRPHRVRTVLMYLTTYAYYLYYFIDDEPENLIE